MDIAHEYIKDVDKLPPCPEIALEVLTIAHEEECSIPKLAERIERDPVLTANMLRMANSAYFGCVKQISSIADIVVRLGLESVKIIAITCASAGVLRSAQEAYSLEQGKLWEHSYATAILAAILGRYAKAQEQAALYTAALLHDIGKVVLNEPLRQEQFNQGERESGMTLVEYERRLLHTDHAMVGMALLEKWKVPEAISVPVGMHHTDDQPRARRLNAKIVRLADILVHLTRIDAEQGEFFFDVLTFEDQRKSLPEVPGFLDHMRVIIEEFVDRYQETILVYSL